MKSGQSGFYRIYDNDYDGNLRRGGLQCLVKKNTTFQEALDILESLPKYQQESLIDIVQHRLMEHRRELLAKNITEAREEYARREVKKGTVDDLMREISE